MGNRSAIILCILFLNLSTLFAQESGCGFKAGIVYSTIKISPTSNTAAGKGIFGPVVGGTLYKDFGKRVGLYSEINLSLIGTEYKDTATLYDYSSGSYSLVEKTETLHLWTVSYLIMPVFKFSENFFVMGGPQIDAILRSKYKGESRTVLHEEDHLPATDFIISSTENKPIKIGVTFGVGYSKKLFRADIRYNMNLGNLFDKSIQGFYPEFVGYQSAKYSSLQVSVSMIIPGMKFGTSKDRFLDRLPY